MPLGTFAVNPAQTFATALLMGAGPKTVWGSQEQDRTAAGLLKFECQVAVTFLAENGMRPVSDVLNVTIAAERDPAAGIPPGSAVELVDFRVGWTAPEQRENGKGIRGGRPYFAASALRSVNGHRPAPVKAD